MTEPISTTSLLQSSLGLPVAAASLQPEAFQSTLMDHISAAL